MNDIKIEKYTIGTLHQPFVIAEMSGNHNHSLERALAIVEAAAKSGAHALKLQTYTADTMTIKGVLTINDDNSLWKGRELYDLYNEAFTPWEWHKPIFDRARELGMVAFSTPFDETAVDFLEGLGVAAYKVASFENTDWPLLKKVAKTGKPVIMSTGAATIADIGDAVRVLRENGCSDLVLLKCTSTYPASPENINLNTIPHMRDAFQCHVGLSDHTMGIGVAVASVALGACVIEKHFTLKRSDGGVDSAFSMEPEEMESLVKESKNAFISLGAISYEIAAEERKSLKYKRSIYACKDIEPGEVFTSHNLQIIRPSDGLEPKYYELILGKVVSKPIKAGTPITWDNI